MQKIIVLQNKQVFAIIHASEDKYFLKKNFFKHINYFFRKNQKIDNPRIN